MQKLSIKKVSENNLKSIDVTLPHDSLVVLTGTSGSGKTSLAFDTIYAEGGRRYIETFSPYTRQFLDRLKKPDIESISGVRPSLALEQRNKILQSRSTVGTSTEINDYLKIIWSHLAEAFCPTCKTPIKKTTHVSVFDELRRVACTAHQVLIAFPIHFSGASSLESLGQALLSRGFIRYFDTDNNTLCRIEDLAKQDKHPKAKQFLVVLERMSSSALEGEAFEAKRSHLLQVLSSAFTFGHGKLSIITLGQNGETSISSYHEGLSCGVCKTSLPLARNSLFTFNSPLGACSTCQGFGKILAIDPDLVIPDKRITLEEGAVAPWKTDANKNLFRALIKFCKASNIDTKTPWQKLTPEQQELIFSGTAGRSGYRGINRWFKLLERKKYKMHVRVLLSRYRKEQTCPECSGTRLKLDALNFRLNDLTLPDFWQLPVSKALSFLDPIKNSRNAEEPVQIALNEVISRLQYLRDIGLDYITLDRQSRTLSGGENQRVNLTSILGTRLVNTSLVLDEPTVGLHPQDTLRLISTLFDLRDRGNSLFVVEHDADVIRAADEVVDLGPRSGSEGGEIVYQGSVSGLLQCKQSLTAQYLAKKTQPLKRPLQPTARKSDRFVEIIGARAHNLKNIDVKIPLGCFVALTGVSGSGKSSLVQHCFLEGFERFKRSGETTFGSDAPLEALHGIDSISDIVLIDQSPVGSTPRSNPGTYTKAWDIIRECFAETDEAGRLGLGKSAFSFNVDGGRCPDCKGAGFHKVEMQFLADVYVQCESCGGNRFQDSVLEVRLRGKNIVEMLNLDLKQVAQFFEQSDASRKKTEIINRLQPLLDLGLGYLKLGQPLNMVSGGEAQRIKLASYLNSEGGKNSCLFILDEPTTGLHPYNVEQLLGVIRKLVSSGHSVLCVEHNQDIIRHADWMIDLGPVGGENGGQIIAEGHPEELLKTEAIVKRSSTLQYMLPATTPYFKNSARRAPEKAQDFISVLGARENNLKNVHVQIPKNKLTVVTGVSGSGKSTLAFDIIFNEGQRRFIDCLSPYARQYMKQLKRAEVDLVDSIPPTIAISQKTAPPLGVSTIATTTETYQFLRLLYAKAGVQHCPEHNAPIGTFSSKEIAAALISRYRGKKLFLFAPAVSGRKGYYNDLFQRALKAEIREARIDGKIKSLTTELRLERHKLHWISLLTSSIHKPEANLELLEIGIEQALLLGNGVIEVAVGEKSGEPELFSTERVCPVCRKGFRELDPQDFSFRSKRGVCSRCEGHGVVALRGKQERTEPCPDCEGSRIKALGRSVLFAGKPIHELTRLTAPELLDFLQSVPLDSRLRPVLEPIITELTNRLKVIISVGLDYLELCRPSASISGGEAQRLRLAKALGSPLTGVCYVLDEPTIGLHAQDQQMLLQLLRSLRDAENTLVVVEHDEETICAGDYIIDVGPGGGSRGGHIVAQGTLEDILLSPESVTGEALRERRGASSVTSKTACSGLLPDFNTKKKVNQFLSMANVNSNNLKNVTAKFQLGALNVIAGVSGAGKSSLIHESLVPALSEVLSKKTKGGKKITTSWGGLENIQGISRVLEIDQAPVGKTSSSCPASYIGVFDDIRKLYALTPEAKSRGWTASYFSFNTGKGRCETCSGRGFLQVPMSFLPNAFVQCEQCLGKRYTELSEEIQYQGLSIGELLQKTMEEARELLSNHRRIKTLLDCVCDLGVGYLTLGQPTHTLSGGEAQRLKIARELGATTSDSTLYILDEPTIGLHMTDVARLLAVIRKLIERGNTLIVIEHDLDVLRASDYLLELGPGPGASGGEIIFSGTPSDLQKQTKRTPTQRALNGEFAVKKSFSKLVKSGQPNTIRKDESPFDKGHLPNAPQHNY